MKRLIIGSTAIRHLYPDFSREPKDLDYAVEVDQQNTKGVEYLYNPIICKHCEDLDYIDGDSLLTLKASHMFWDNNWNKHMYDIQFLLSKGHTINILLFDKLVDFWKVYLPKVRRSNLSMSKEDFFSNAVNKDEHQHDHLHTLLNPVPMFTLLLKEGSEVELDESKWYKLSFLEKCDVVFEETAVMAFERMPKLYYKAAYEKQLKDNIVKHFPKYIALFAILNYKKVLTPKINFIEHLKEKLKDEN